MQYPYLLTSDEHHHNWSQFGTVGADGINTRLAAILAEKKLAHAALASRGGSFSVNAGDLFHVRGKIEPSVFNPTFDNIAEIHETYPGLETLAIPGNHDLEGKNSSALGNAMQQLDKIAGFNVATKVRRYGDVIVVPWYQDLDHLRAELKVLATKFVADLDHLDVVIHAPVNGVIRGIPDHGLEAQELADLGFRRVFAGHYHDHKVFCGGKVVSIGATTHQTWNDPGTLAGFLLVYPDRIEHIESTAPKFVDLLAQDIADEAELAMIVGGNYVRAKIDGLSEAEINKFREELKDAGALGSIIISNNAKKTVSRTATTVSASKSLESSVAEYVENQLKPTKLVEAQKLVGDLLAQARSES